MAGGRGTWRIDPARPDEAPLVTSLLTEAAGWLAAQGIDQWPNPFPPEAVVALVARGETYLVRLGPRAVATLTLLWDDPVFWGPQPPVAGYVHRLAVTRAHAGRGLGAELLDWAERVVADSGREFLRLDCARGNARLRRYYENLGFAHRGDISVPAPYHDVWWASRYERPVRPPGRS